VLYPHRNEKPWFSAVRRFAFRHSFRWNSNIGDGAIRKRSGGGKAPAPFVASRSKRRCPNRSRCVLPVACDTEPSGTSTRRTWICAYGARNADERTSWTPSSGWHSSSEDGRRISSTRDRGSGARRAAQATASCWSQPSGHHPRRQRAGRAKSRRSSMAIARVSGCSPFRRNGSARASATPSTRYQDRRWDTRSRRGCRTE